MKSKQKTLAIKRARRFKTWRDYYFGTFLPREEGSFESGVIYAKI